MRADYEYAVRMVGTKRKPRNMCCKAMLPRTWVVPKTHLALGEYRSLLPCKLHLKPPTTSMSQNSKESKHRVSGVNHSVCIEQCSRHSSCKTLRVARLSISHHCTVVQVGCDGMDEMSS